MGWGLAGQLGGHYRGDGVVAGREDWTDKHPDCDWTVSWAAAHDETESSAYQ